MKLFRWRSGEGKSTRQTVRKQTQHSPPDSPKPPTQPASPHRLGKLLPSGASRRQSVEGKSKPRLLQTGSTGRLHASPAGSSTLSANSTAALKARGKDGRSAPENYEMRKRRVRINLAIIERPLMTDTDVVVDVRYRSVKMVGSGSYGIVVSAIDDNSGNRVAIKKIFSAFSTGRMARAVLREVRLLRHLRHPNIVHLLDIDVPRQYRAWDEVYIVTPLLRMDLRHALQNGLVKTELQRKRVAYGLLRALEHMHSLGLMHRDIKSRNVLLDEDFNAQICDLGHARFYSRATPELLGRGKEQDGEPELSMHLTTIVQSAPELCLGGEYDAEVDIWAAGCVIAEMQHPQHGFLFDTTQRQAHVQEIVDVVGFPDADVEEVIPQAGQWYLRMLRKTKLNGKTLIAERLGSGANAMVVDLLEKMLRFSPKQRLSAKEALEHPWFDEVRGQAQVGTETYNFSQSEPPRKASRAQMKNAVWEEVVAFHPEAPSLGVR